MARKLKLSEIPVASESIWNDQEYGYMLERWLRSLRAENERVRQSTTAPAQSVCSAITGRLLSFLTLAADAADLSSAVRYTALDLYCRFITRHIESMTSYVESNSGSAAKPEQGSSRKTRSHRSRDTGNDGGRAQGDLQETEELLERVVERLAEQTPLRLLSCLQLASKLHSHSNNLTIPKLRALLRRLGQDYSARAVVRSETRVLSTLEHRCSCQSSHLDYIDSLVMRLKLSFRCRKTTVGVEAQMQDVAKSSHRRRRSSGDEDEEIFVTKRQHENQTGAEETLAPARSRREPKTNDKSLIKGSKRADKPVSSKLLPSSSSRKREYECFISSTTAPSKALKPNNPSSPRELSRDYASQTAGEDEKVAAALYENMDSLRRTATVLLDAALLQHEQLYRALLLHITGSADLPQQFRQAYARVEEDRLLLCCSLVHAAAGLQGGHTYTTAVGPLLAHHTSLSLTDICTFSGIITNVLVQGSQP